MKFSFIIPIYNVEEYLPRCIESVMNQTYGDIEIILVDDGSPDNCPKLCDDYAEKDNRIRVIHKENGGLSDARNRGLEIATGDYVFFLDSDDYIERDTCERFLPYATRNYDILVGDTCVENADFELNRITERNMMTGKEWLEKSVRAYKFIVVAWINAYKTSFLKGNNLYFKKGILYEDSEFTPRCFLKCGSVINTGIWFYHYCIRPDSITTRSDQKKGAEDYYSTCLSLEKIYRTLEQPLRNLMLDCNVCRYLAFLSKHRILIDEKKLEHKAFCLRNARSIKTFFKALLYAVSPRLFYRLYDLHQRRKLERAAGKSEFDCGNARINA